MNQKMKTIKESLENINPLITMIAAVIGFLAGYLVFRGDVQEIKDDIKEIYELEMKEAECMDRV